MSSKERIAERRRRVVDLRSQNASTRTIAAAIGVNQSIIVRDLAAMGDAAPRPERIQASDGRVYLRRQLEPSPPVDPLAELNALAAAVTAEGFVPPAGATPQVLAETFERTATALLRRGRELRRLAHTRGTV